MRIPSGVTDQYVYFVAVDSTDFTTRETGLSSFTVYRSRNGAAASAMTTPTINEVDSTNMPGVYELLLDEDMTLASGNQSEEICFHITQASMAPVTRTVEIYRPSVSAGETLTVSSGLATLPTITANWLTAAGTAADFTTEIQTGLATTDAVVDAVFDEALSGHSTAGTAGKALSDILVDTSEIGSAGAGLTDLGGMSTAMRAQVNTEAADVLFTDTDAEPAQGIPGATISVADKIGFLYKAWRNKSTSTSSAYNVYNDDTTTIDHKATVTDDGTTATRTEIVSGP